MSSFITDDSKQKIETFLNGRFPNTWMYLYDKDLHMYVRRGIHLWDGDKIETFDIANWYVGVNAKHTIIEMLTPLLNHLESKFNMFFENVLDADVLMFLDSRDYDIRRDGMMPTALLLHDSDFTWATRRSNTAHDKAFKRAMSII